MTPQRRRTAALLAMSASVVLGPVLLAGPASASGTIPDEPPGGATCAPELPRDRLPAGAGRPHAHAVNHEGEHAGQPREHPEHRRLQAREHPDSRAHRLDHARVRPVRRRAPAARRRPRGRRPAHRPRLTRAATRSAPSTRPSPPSASRCRDRPGPSCREPREGGIPGLSYLVVPHRGGSGAAGRRADRGAEARREGLPTAMSSVLSVQA